MQHELLWMLWFDEKVYLTYILLVHSALKSEKIGKFWEILGSLKFSYRAFHNSSYDFFTVYETSDFMIYLTKSWGLEKNIELCCLFWFVDTIFFFNPQLMIKSLIFLKLKRFFYSTFTVYFFMTSFPA